MTSVLLPPSPRLVRALPTALSLLALPVLAVAQNASDPLNLGYESATESHRGFDDEMLPRDGEPVAHRPAALPDVETGATVKPAGKRPTPVDPGAVRRSAPDEVGSRARELAYDSALEGYTPYESSDAPDWVGSNDTVGEIGGWRTYAREAFASDDEASDGAEPEPGAMEPEMAAAAPPASGTDAKPAGSRPVPVEPEAGDRTAANDATPAAEDAPQRTRALVYDSVLEDYTAYEESDGPNWIEANQVVGEIGGWRTYARELFESSDDEGEGQ